MNVPGGALPTTVVNPDSEAAGLGSRDAEAGPPDGSLPEHAATDIASSSGMATRDHIPQTHETKAIIRSDATTLR